MLGAIARPEEHRWLAELAASHPAVHWDRLLFSMKESVYKAWYPLTGKWLDFEEASIAVDPDGRHLHRAAAGARTGARRA